MADQPAFRTATLKPGIDKAIAREGVQVVLWGDAEEAVVLHFCESAWSVTRHPAIGSDVSSASARVSWQGASYAASGERVAEFDDAAPLSDWRRFYDDFFSAQRARVRSHLVRDGNAHAV